MIKSLSSSFGLVDSELLKASVFTSLGSYFRYPVFYSSVAPNLIGHIFRIVLADTQSELVLKGFTIPSSPIDSQALTPLQVYFVDNRDSKY